MEDIPVMERSALRCAARINNTIPCPNTAMAGSAYCWAHRNLQVAEADDDLLPVDDLTTPPPLASGETNDDETPDLFVDDRLASTEAPWVAELMHWYTWGEGQAPWSLYRIGPTSR